MRPEWAGRVRELVDAAPPLSPGQLDRLAALFSSAPGRPAVALDTPENGPERAAGPPHRRAG